MRSYYTLFVSTELEWVKIENCSFDDEGEKHISTGVSAKGEPEFVVYQEKY